MATKALIPAAIPKTMQQLLNEINQLKEEVASSIRTWERIDTRRKNAATNRDRSVEGRMQIKHLNDRIYGLETQMNSITKESDPTWPIKTFDKSKQDALHTLSNLRNKLNKIDKHLEKAIGNISPSMNKNVQPIAASPASTDGENTKGIGALVRRLSFSKAKKTSLTSNSDDQSEDKEDDVIVHKAQGLQSSSAVTKKIETSADESEDTQDSEDDINDRQQLLNELRNNTLINDNSQDSRDRDHYPQRSTPPRANQKPPTFPVHSPSRSRKDASTLTSSSSSRTTTPSSEQHAIIRTTKKDIGSGEDSYFEENDDKDESEPKKLTESTDQDDEEYIPMYNQRAEDESTDVNGRVEQFRRSEYPPGTKFRVTHDLKGIQPGDLTVHIGDTLVLIKQTHNDWWSFKNSQTQEEGVVPINHIQLLSDAFNQGRQRHIRPIPSSSSTLVDVFKSHNYIPSGFVSSYLAPLTKQDKYKLFYTLIPKMSESNFAFDDLHWRYDTNCIHVREVDFQKILTIKKCSKIPRIKGEQVKVLDRCIRICLYDGFEIISNIHSSHAKFPDRTNEEDSTEDWNFTSVNSTTYIDEQSEFLIRSNEYHPSKEIFLLIELTQFCESLVNHEKCEIGCGWIIKKLDDDELSGISGTKSFSKRLHGGNIHQSNILLNSEYRNLRSDGLGGRIDKYKQARIHFSIQSREEHIDVLYDNLPLTSMVIPINLVQTIVFYRNELAYQVQKYARTDNLSSTPIDSIFLSTFYQILEQPDLICTLQKLYKRHKHVDGGDQREEFIKVYESSIYPLLFYRLLPSYDFHDRSIIYERKKLIQKMINQQIAENKRKPLDILTLLLDPALTDTWTPFTTDEVCFSLQKYVSNFTSND